MDSKRLRVPTLKNYIMLNTKIKETSGYGCVVVVVFFLKSKRILYSPMKTEY